MLDTEPYITKPRKSNISVFATVVYQSQDHLFSIQISRWYHAIVQMHSAQSVDKINPFSNSTLPVTAPS